MRKRIPTWIRNIVELEKGEICGICRKKIKFGETYEIDHIYPVSRGGSNSIENLHVVHKKCNRKKGTKIMMESSDKWNVWWDLVRPHLDGLRENQKEAISNTIDRLINVDKYPEDYRIYPGGRPKIYCECTGAGKSILMVLLGILLAKKRILVVTPSVVIRTNNFEALDDTYHLGIVPKKVYDEIKITTLEKSNTVAYVNKADIVVATYQKLGRILPHLREDTFDVVLIDEAHHYKEDQKYEATIHRDIVRKFKNAVTLFFTATPFDARLNPILNEFDKERDVIHEFTYADAWKEGYVKYIEWTEIKPAEQTLVITHPNGRSEKLQLSFNELEEAKKIRGYKSAIARSKATKLSLIHATLQLLDQRNEDLRGLVKKNIALIVFQNIEEAEDCSKLLDSMNLHYKHCLVHSNIPKYKSLIKEIKNDVYDIVLSVAIFKEGFDQKNITIVTLDRNIQSYVFFTQVIGRGVRSRKDIHGRSIPVAGPHRNMKDICFIVTHEGFNLQKFWDLFRELDLESLTDDKEEREFEIKKERGEPTDYVSVEPIIRIEDEKVTGYVSDGFSEGRTLRDETHAFWFKEAVEKSDDFDLKRTIENIWQKDEGVGLSQLFQKARSLDFANRRNIGGKPSFIEEGNKKKDFQEETMDKAKMLQGILRKQIAKWVRGIGHGRRLNWGILGKVMSNTFIQIHHHPLKGGSSKSDYKLTPAGIDFINNELPKLIENYRSYEYFKTEFLPRFKKNLDKEKESFFFT